MENGTQEEHRRRTRDARLSGLFYLAMAALGVVLGLAVQRWLL